VHVARKHPLSRGWLTQLDVKYNAPIRGDDGHRLTAAEYRTWLITQNVRFVAVPDAPLDPSAEQAARIIATRPSFLRPVWSDRHWRVFEVRGTRPPGAADLVRLGPESFTVRGHRRGVRLLPVRWTPYWRIVRGTGCLAPSRTGWTMLHTSGPGTITVQARFDLRRVVSRGRTCSRNGAPATSG
jgi:hypothetical protein